MLKYLMVCWFVLFNIFKNNFRQVKYNIIFELFSEVLFGCVLQSSIYDKYYVQVSKVIYIYILF